MGITHRLTRACNDGTNLPAIVESNTAGSEVNVSELIPANSTDLVVAFAFLVAKIKSFYITSDVAMTVKTIHSGSTQETITLLAGQAMLWSLADASLLPLPFANDVASLKVTNTTAGTLNIRTIVDPT